MAQCIFSAIVLFPYPFAIAKPFDKPQADKAQLDIPCNHRYPDFNLPSGKQLVLINSLE